MRHATLLYNPVAGRGSDRLALLQSVATELAGRGIEAVPIATEGPGTAGDQAALAAQRSEIVFACGGDGTVHEVLQGLVAHPGVSLGVLPFGSANVLARHLRLPLHPVKAAIAQSNRQSVAVPLGRVFYTTDSGEQSRFFASLAGAGADGMLIYRMMATDKHQLGRTAYYLRALKLFVQARYSPFRLRYRPMSDQEAQEIVAVSAMAMRVENLGGLFRRMAPHASVEHAHLSLTAILPPSTWSLPAWFAMGWAGLAHRNRFQLNLGVRSFACGEGLFAPVQVQADGEWLGRTPMSITLMENAIRLFLPQPSTSRLAR